MTEKMLPGNSFGKTTGVFDRRLLIPIGSLQAGIIRYSASETMYLRRRYLEVDLKWKKC